VQLELPDFVGHVVCKVRKVVQVRQVSAVQRLPSLDSKDLADSEDHVDASAELVRLRAVSCACFEIQKDDSYTVRGRTAG